MNTEIGASGTGDDAVLLLQALRDGMTLAGEPRHAVPAFLIAHGCPATARHCAAVADEARRIAALVGADADAAERAGWFHDVSAIVPTAGRVAAAHTLGVDILPEEAAFPMILHQKLSAVLARDLFGERNDAVLSAIGCHTTLKVAASTLDTVVFVADKVAWDQPGVPPYRDALLAALAPSLDAAALVYLDYLRERRATLGVIHPWLQAAYQERCERNVR
ncbi:MAG: HD domain-containing protein [Thermomicrobiales bacterium]